MHTKGHPRNSLFIMNWNPANVTLVIMLTLLFLIFLFLFMTLTATPAQAQTFNVVHTFGGGADGAYPCAGLTSDAAGNLYGTASGTQGCGAGSSSGGTVFRLSRRSSGWIFTPLYIFQGGSDGADPLGRVIIGPDGSLYGTTSGGGYGCGTAFQLRPPTQVPPNVTGGWTETILYRFTGNDDGCWPSGDLIFDQAGNIYGTTIQGGINSCVGWDGCGTVFQLTPSGSGWTEIVLHSFDGYDGQLAWYTGVILDRSGNLYGMTVYGGDGGCEYGPCGNVFQLTHSASGWTENNLYIFHGETDGAQPIGGLLIDQQGILYGTTAGHGSGEGGTVFTLTPQGGGWGFTVLYSFSGQEFEGPYAGLVLDRAGNLYGTTYEEGSQGRGSVFKLTRSFGWSYMSLHDFTGGGDGGRPWANVVLSAGSNLYGTTSEGGSGNGVAWEITP